MGRNYYKPLLLLYLDYIVQPQIFCGSKKVMNDIKFQRRFRTTAGNSRSLKLQILLRDFCSIRCRNANLTAFSGQGRIY